MIGSTRFLMTTILCLAALRPGLGAASPAQPSAGPDRTGVNMTKQESQVDFSYAFAPPHRITLARPDSSDKTLLDLNPGSLRIAWSYDNLLNYPISAFKTPPANWSVTLTPQIDGHPFAHSSWRRIAGWVPGLDNRYEDPSGTMTIEVIGGRSAAVGKIELHNASGKAVQFALHCDSGSWGENPAWVDPKHLAGDNLVAGWNERADRVLFMGVGADAWSAAPDGMAPGPRSMLMLWTLKPGEQRTAWIVRPYRAYAADLPALRATKWDAEMDFGQKEWEQLIGRSAQLSIPDPVVANAYRACLADLFVMREPTAGGFIGAEPGTEVYRAAGAGFEAAISSVAIDQAGYAAEARNAIRLGLETQEPDGNWDDPKGWGHLMWGNAGTKAWAVMNHYRLTGSRAYLLLAYPRLAACARWQERQRATTRVGDPAANIAYGLMPRGMGDCGLMNDGDLYGIFLPHNIWAVYADRQAVEAAEILGKTEDLPELRKIYETGRADLLRALDRGAIPENGYRWIPGVPGKTSGSLWGGLNALFPCAILAPDDPLIDGAIRHMESRLSPGGIPVHTGWLANGMWVAITLDNLADAHLARGNGDAAARYLYAVLNHGTPLFTWCEERGQEAGTSECTGDRQHLWTPVAVVRCIRDCLVMERKGGLELALGTPRDWLPGGHEVGIENAPTYFGRVTWKMSYDDAAGRVQGVVSLARGANPPRVTLHIRLPEGRRIASVDSASGASVTPDGSALTWNSPRGSHRFVATVR